METTVNNSALEAGASNRVLQGRFGSRFHPPNFEGVASRNGIEQCAGLYTQESLLLFQGNVLQQNFAAVKRIPAFFRYFAYFHAVVPHTSNHFRRGIA